MYHKHTTLNSKRKVIRASEACVTEAVLVVKVRPSALELKHGLVRVGRVGETKGKAMMRKVCSEMHMISGDGAEGLIQSFYIRRP